MKLTTRLGIICPRCNRELEAATKGLFGGLFVQSIIHGLVKRIKNEGATVTCGHCKHKWDYVPKHILNQKLDNFFDDLQKEVKKQNES